VHVATIDGNDLVRVPNSARFTVTGTTVVGVRHPGDATYQVMLKRSDATSILVAHITDTPGWSAHANGAVLSMTNGDGVAYQLAVPKDTTEVTFSYRPPHLELGEALFLLALIMWLADASILRRSRGRAKDAAEEPVSELEPELGDGTLPSVTPWRGL
jgi:hypothetical protein